MADRARQKTDKRLSVLEQKISRLYATSPLLKEIRAEYRQYMKGVQSRTEEPYSLFANETDIGYREELKNRYKRILEAETVYSKQYQDIIQRFAEAMAKVNQQAIDMINDEMISVYTENYNQVAVDCRKVGIKVNDKSGEAREK